eukprot:412914_1
MKHTKLAYCLFSVLLLIAIVYVYEHWNPFPKSQQSNLIPYTAPRDSSRGADDIPATNLSPAETTPDSEHISESTIHTSPNASDQNVTNNQPEGVSQRAQKPMLDDIFGFALVPYDILLKRKQSVIDLVNEKIPNQAESHSSYVGKTATGKQHVYAFLVPSSGNHSTSNQMQTPA